MADSGKKTINEDKSKSAELRKHFNKMNNLQQRQFFKSTEEEDLKEILRNLLWALDEKDAQNEKAVADQIAELQSGLVANKKRREGRDKQLKKYL